MHPMVSAMDQLPQDIIKMGYLKKLKTMKSKLFVLRAAPPGGDGPQLEYYDSERKFRGVGGGGGGGGHRAKRVIGLRDCLSITAMVDTRRPNAIALYTPDDCFALVCASGAERADWLETLQEVRIADGCVQPHFDYIWSVSVKPRGLGSSKHVPARAYRLCLTDLTLGLIRVSCVEPDIVFQLASIRRCGHSDCQFFMELGRSAVTGAGELWMQVDDAVVAQGMHEVILSKMKSMNSSADQPHFRQRSRSSVSDKVGSKPISMPARGYDSATLPLRSKTIGAGDHARSPLARRQSHSPSSKGSTLRLPTGQHSPVTSSPLSFSSFTPDSQRSRTNSLESHGSRGTSSSLSVDDDYPHSPPRGGGSDKSHGSLCGSMTPTRLAAFDNAIPEATSEYLSMDANSGSNRSGDKSDSDYMGMDGGPATPRTPADADADGYMDMLPSWGDATCPEAAAAAAAAAATLTSSTSSGHETDEGAYFDMTAPASHPLATVQEKFAADDGYLQMTPSSSPSVVSHAGASDVRLDPVTSYLQDDGDSGGGSGGGGGGVDFPKRAYSVGSKPCSSAQQGGAGAARQSYMDMSSSQKSSSAPHLLGGRAGGPAWGGWASRRKQDLPEFMELEFGGRPRSSSGGQRDLRQRTLTANLSAAAVVAGDRQQRPRTATICGDSLRPRTTSFGSGAAGDMRPRSASHGNARYGGRAGAERQLGSGASQRASQEAIDAACGGSGAAARRRASEERVETTDAGDYVAVRRRTTDGATSDYVNMGYAPPAGQPRRVPTVRVEDRTGEAARSQPSGPPPFDPPPPFGPVAAFKPLAAADAAADAAGAQAGTDSFEPIKSFEATSAAVMPVKPTARFENVAASKPAVCTATTPVCATDAPASKAVVATESESPREPVMAKSAATRLPPPPPPPPPPPKSKAASEPVAPFELSSTFQPLTAVDPPTAAAAAAAAVAAAAAAAAPAIPPLVARAAPPCLHSRSSAGNLRSLHVDVAETVGTMPKRLSCSSLPVLGGGDPPGVGRGGAGDPGAGHEGSRGHALHYATLDLKAAADDGGTLTPPVPTAAAATSAAEWFIAPPGDDPDEAAATPLAYTQIDFVKSEELKAKHLL